MITRLAAGDLGNDFYLKDLADLPDDHRPFSRPRYWGGFICQGMPGPLRATSRSEHSTFQAPQAASSSQPGQPGRFRRWLRSFGR
jgi:hypothetical protein